MSETSDKIEKKFRKFIIAVSVVIPLAVAVLFNVKLRDFGIDVAPLSFLPPIYATINALTAIVLVAAVWAIKNGNRKVHERLMNFAIMCSVLFLVMYVAYHMTSDSTVYGDINADGVRSADEKAEVGNMLYVYAFILLTHILLSIVIIPMVLFTYVRALAQRFDRHKRLARITFPLWLYVAVTGVVVYLMISPYYAH